MSDFEQVFIKTLCVIVDAVTKETKVHSDQTWFVSGL